MDAEKAMFAEWSPLFLGCFFTYSSPTLFCGFSSSSFTAHSSLLTLCSPNVLTSPGWKASASLAQAPLPVLSSFCYSGTLRCLTSTAECPTVPGFCCLQTSVMCGYVLEMPCLGLHLSCTIVSLFLEWRATYSFLNFLHLHLIKVKPTRSQSGPHLASVWILCLPRLPWQNLGTTFTLFLFSHHFSSYLF